MLVLDGIPLKVPPKIELELLRNAFNSHSRAVNLNFDCPWQSLTHPKRLSNQFQGERATNRLV